MTERIIVDVEWDAEAGVWIAAASSIGLYTEAATLDLLKERVVVIAADLLSDGDEGSRNVPLALNVALDQRVAA